MTKGQKMLDPETIHRNVNGGWLRPAVFGAMDGLVSNFALMIGVAGGSKAIGAENTTAIVLAGFAGLLAGAFSMAAGEYTSVASQAELAMAEIELKKQELRENPEREIDSAVLSQMCPYSRNCALVALLAFSWDCSSTSSCLYCSHCAPFSFTRS